MDRIEVLKLYNFINSSKAVAKLRKDYIVQLRPNSIGEFAIRVYLVRRVNRHIDTRKNLTGENGFIDCLNEELEQCPVKACVAIESRPRFNDVIIIHVFPKIPVKK